MDERSRKRQTDGDEVSPAIRPITNSDFMKGGITRIKLFNFLTFDDVEIRPTPGLNVVLGPNGTGKSSLVCAICVGLAGSLSLLGRAREMKYFVKHGKKSGWVEIDLFTGNPDKPITVRRVISGSNNQSVWSLNGKQTKEQQIVEVVRNLNIQLSNHCQFLPQDMVVKFAQMNSKELLEATEKAIGGIEMFENHQKLKLFQSVISEMEQSLTDNKTRYDSLLKKNALISSEVERFRSRHMYLTEVKMLKTKKCWVEYTDGRAAFTQCRDIRKKKDQELIELKKQIAPYQQQKTAREQAVSGCRDQLNVLIRRKQALKSSVEGLRLKLKDLEDVVDHPRQELEDKIKEDTKRKKEIEKFMREVEVMKRDLASLEEEMGQMQLNNQESYNNRLREIQLQLADLKGEAQRKARDVERLEMDREDFRRQLKRQRERADSRLMLIQQKNRDTYEAVLWLRKNQQLFHHPIIEPIILVANCKTQEFLPQVESVIRGRDMFSFVAQSKDDLHLFMTEVHDKMKLKVSGVTAPGNPLSSFSPDVPMEQLRRFGFKSMVLDHIDAPEPVLSYLCVKYFVHNVPIAGELSAADIENFEKNLPRSLKGLRYFAGKSDFNVMRSRFADHTISRSREIGNPQFLMHRVNMANIQELEKKMQEADNVISSLTVEVNSISDECGTLRKEDAEIRQKKNHVLSLRNRTRTLKSNIDHREIRIDNMRQNVIDLEAEQEKCREAVREAQQARVKGICSLTKRLKEYVDICENVARAAVARSQAELEREVHVKACRDSEEALKQKEGECRQLQISEAQFKESAKHLLEVARKETGVKSPGDLPMDTKEKYDSYPNDLAALDGQIHHYQAKADLCAGTDQRVVDDFTRREEEIDQLAGKVQASKEEISKKVTEMSTTKTQWRSALDQSMEEINEKFSRFFSEMGCAGQVNLNDQGTDFANYGIDIRVKFRDSESLQLLTSQRQSGGERSVSTMLYLLALQDMTKCPFRAVDEINQGMDPVNERKVFNLIVDSVSGRSTAQYFLFTPKLLHGLSFGPHVTVHCIHNGPEMLDSKTFDVRKFIDSHMRSSKSP